MLGVWTSSWSKYGYCTFPLELRSCVELLGNVADPCTSKMKSQSRYSHCTCRPDKHLAVRVINQSVENQHFAELHIVLSRVSVKGH